MSWPSRNDKVQRKELYTSSQVSVRFYGDGSGPSFDIRKPGVKEDGFGGVNERLAAKDRRAGEDLLLNEKATRLRYARGFCYTSMPFLMIDGDNGRMFPPQAWAAGFFPIIPLERVFSFCAYGSVDPLKFDTKRAAQSPEFLKVAIILILNGWKLGDFVSPDLERAKLARLLREGLLGGAPLAQEQVDQALIDLIKDGMVLGHGGGGFEFCGRPGWDENERVSSTIDFLRYLWGLVEPLAIIPHVDPRTFSDQMWWNRVEKQGWESPHAKSESEMREIAELKKRAISAIRNRGRGQFINFGENEVGDDHREDSF